MSELEVTNFKTSRNDRKQNIFLRGIACIFKNTKKNLSQKDDTLQTWKP